MAYCLWVGNTIVPPCYCSKQGLCHVMNAHCCSVSAQKRLNTRMMVSCTLYCVCVHQSERTNTQKTVETQQMFNLGSLASWQQLPVTSSAQDRSILMRSEQENEIWLWFLVHKQYISVKIELGPNVRRLWGIEKCEENEKKERKIKK